MRHIDIRVLLIILVTFASVFEDTVAHFTGHRRASRHGRTAIDLDQPRFQIFTEHEIRAVQFKRILDEQDSSFFLSLVLISSTFRASIESCATSIEQMIASFIAG
jgi:hypothetical protein